MTPETLPYSRPMRRGVHAPSPGHGVRLARALACGELVVYHQPKLDFRSGNICGTEALLRWQHPKRGLLEPSAFETALYEPRDDLALFSWVLGESLTHCQHWLMRGYALPVSVNVTPHELLHPAFVTLIQQTASHCRLNGLPAFALELVECGPVSDLDKAVEVLEACAESGVKLALDDFGTGYSTMTLLQRLPATTIKIDRSFVFGILSDDRDRTMVASMFELASSLGKTVIAEGVETESHALELGKMGISVLQGYGISRPIRFERLTEWIERSTISNCWWASPAVRPRSPASALACHLSDRREQNW